MSHNGPIVRITAAGDRSVGYELSALGCSFADGPLVALGRWAVDHADQIIAAQEQGSSGLADPAAVG